MPVHPTPGLPADWLNGWLAALGVTVILPDARLAWSEDPVPHAVVHHPTDHLAQHLLGALPTVEDLGRLAIARHLGHAELKRNVPLAVYQERARYARTTPSGPTSHLLASTLTDLIVEIDEASLPHSPFDVPVPRGITLWERAVSCRETITGREAVEAALEGRGQRVRLNGLAFDIRRVASRAENTPNLVVPIVELLAFAALTLFPIRGDGRREQTRGWSDRASRRGSFTWGTWTEPLDRWAIDAWLDRLYAGRRPRATARFTTVPYQPTGSADVTRGYATERVS